MRLRLSLCTTTVLLLAAWLAVTTVSRSGDNRFVLEVPATYLSVGQQFRPRLVSQAATAAVPSDAIDLELLDARHQPVAVQALALDGAATVAANPLALPAAGAYTLRAKYGDKSQSITLHALPEPAADYGGVLPVADLGLPAGVDDYLRQHSFLMETLGPNSSPRLLLVGDPRLEGGDLLAQYGALWRAVAAGTPALLLQPPPPGVALAWPLTAPLAAVAGECGEDLAQPPLEENLSHDAALEALLRPPLSFDVAAQSSLDLYHWDGRRLERPNPHAGYAGCHALLSFRYGAGWVTVSTLPLLQHFQDVRARIYLMNLLRAAALRKRAAPASPGLAWVMQQRLKSMAVTQPLSAAAVFYRAPPAATEPAARLVPAATDQDLGSCFRAPADAGAGATLTLDLGRPQPLHTLSLDFAAWPAGFSLAASAGGGQWTALPPAAPPATGPLSLPLPSGPWQQIRLTLAAPGAPAWRLCQFSAQ